MIIKVLQLNLYQGLLIDEVITYIKDNDIDILQLQEVGGKLQSKSVFDNGSYLQEKLSYTAEMAVCCTYQNDPDSYMGNAIFFKPSFIPLDKKVVWLKPYAEIDETYHLDRKKTKDLPRNALALLLSKDNTSRWFVTTHLAWGPTPQDEPYKVAQGKILYDFLQSLHHPFVLSGDFNVTGESSIVKMMETIAVNHTKQAGIKNTLNGNIHRAKNLFPQGLAVDYIFTSNGLKTGQCTVVDTPDLSDHFGVRLELLTD